MNELKVSVRYLVEFVLRSGDLKSGEGLSKPEAMLEGGRIHRKLQKAMGSTYRSEVPLKYEKEYDSFVLIIEGRADGIYKVRGTEVIDEIKGTYTDLSTMEEPVPVHLAQACCYAYMHALDNGLKKIRVQVRYCNMRTENIRKFSVDYTFEELEKWFDELLGKYYRWAEHLATWKDILSASARGLEFPFEYRPGQQQLTADVYKTILRSRQLYVQAATGTGKTMSVVFPAVHALSNDLAGKIFYLTAKTVTGLVAQEAADILRRKGLRIKSLYMTAKEKLCPYEETVCDPEVCERAKGHYDRVNDALYELLVSEDSYVREGIAEAARKACVCPYELQLDLADFADMVIGDYNYAFDPEARLKRFFGVGSSKKEALILADEAHNLVSRAREMYSAELVREDVLAVRKLVKEHDKKLYNALGRVNSLLLALKRSMPDKNLAEIPYDEKLEFQLLNASAMIEGLMEDLADRKVREELLAFYFNVRHFLGICELFNDDDYLIYGRNYDDGKFGIRLYCVNPAGNLQKVFDLCRSSVLFSATLLPVKYYQSLLSTQEKYAVYVPSPFDPKRRIILNGTDVSSRYKSRGQSTYERIAGYLLALARSKKGRYMAYFPSYQMMESVYDIFFREKDEELSVIMQNRGMDEKDRESFLEYFEAEGRWLMGFGVLGGIFSEGIDLTGDKLIGAAVIGTGLPKVTEETDLLRAHYDRNGMDGFDYAYKYPGMNKVQQAAGRVIRTVDDEGVILLLDDRFAQSSYRSIFPREWSDIRKCSISNVSALLKEFWDSRDK